jgi:Fur family transcriptional regulator, zinc uptake regulator
MTPKKAQSIDAQLDAAAQACAREGAQLTELRRIVLRLILEAEGPLTAYQLLDRLKAIRTGAVPPTIYRALDFLMDHALIHKLERLSAFIPCRDAGHHDHAAQFLICRHCGTVAEIEDQGVLKALERAAQRAGFQPGVATVELDGTCAACARSA